MEHLLITVCFAIAGVAVGRAIERIILAVIDSDRAVALAQLALFRDHAPGEDAEVAAEPPTSTTEA